MSVLSLSYWDDTIVWKGDTVLCMNCTLCVCVCACVCVCVCCACVCVCVVCIAPDQRVPRHDCVNACAQLTEPGNWPPCSILLQHDVTRWEYWRENTSLGLICLIWEPQLHKYGLWECAEWVHNNALHSTMGREGSTPPFSFNVHL